MKRIGPWAIGIGMLVSVGSAAVGQAREATCSVATLRGLYMFAQSGYTTVQGSLLPQGVAGKAVFHGNGAFESLATISVGGVIIQDDAAPGTYIVNPDCTGTVTVLMKAPVPDVHLDIFIKPDGSQFFTIETDAGSVLSGTEWRVAPDGS
jgi:hypothetical protein